MLQAGARLGTLEVLGPLGAGGMGEVYRARDTRLGREVAVKILPDRLSNDPDRRSRFEREARLLASLNHPFIATVHGLESDHGRLALVMELVEGQTLAERLRRGPLPEREAIQVACQIAGALEAAHDRGIVHRDLKPSNVKVTPDGRVKLLDFGLAKVIDPEADGSSDTSTATPPTGDGAVLGTAPYMSPEQARGLAVDSRTDVWAFGCLLYEMATGRRAFAGATVADVTAAILEREPEWPAMSSRHEALLPLARRCLRKRREDRLREIADARLELEELLGGARDSRRVQRLRDDLGDGANQPRYIETVLRRGYRWIASPESQGVGPAFGRGLASRLPVRLAVAGALVTAAIATVMVRGGLGDGWGWAPGRSSAAPVRFRIDVEQTGVTGAATVGAAGMVDSMVAMCPDGSCVVYRGAEQGVGRLYLRRFDQYASLLLPGTESAEGPFFSPEGRWLAFFAENRLKRLSLDGLGVEVLCEAPGGSTGTWTADGFIFFAPSRGGPVSRVAADGGTPRAVTQLDRRSGETAQRHPVVLPGGKVILYESQDATAKSRIVAHSLETGARSVLLEGGHPRFMHTGHLLFVADGSLSAVPLDARALRVAGPAVHALERPFERRPTQTGWGWFDISADGGLAWMATSPRVESRLWQVERSGRAAPISNLRRVFHWPRLSPDGRRLAVTILEETGSNIWVYDMARRSLTRLTFEGRNNAAAVWSPDGRRLAYRSDRAGPSNLFAEPADGSGPVERLTNADLPQYPVSFSPDGRALSFTEWSPTTLNDVWLLSLDGRTRQPLLQSKFGEWDGCLSPDGRLVAYTTRESGRLEVYVRPRRGTGGKVQVSNEGGNSPVWARSGRELFYLNGNKMMTAPIRPLPGLVVGTPKLLFEGDYLFAGMVANYDVMPDDQEFVMLRAEPASPWLHLNVVLHWSEELKHRAPTPAGVAMNNDVGR